MADGIADPSTEGIRHGSIILGAVAQVRVDVARGCKTDAMDFRVLCRIYQFV